MLKIKLLSDNSTMPEWSSDGCALDLYSAENRRVDRFVPTKIRLGIATEFPPHYVAILKERSGLASEGLHVLGGVIDPSYRGEWKAVLWSSYSFSIEIGQRICQALFVIYHQPSLRAVIELADSGRGTKGFGSSGI